MEKLIEQQEIKDIIATNEGGFGYLLKTARNEKNLSISDIARELRLNEKIILALESEDHTQLPVPAFVCGYIRNYSKFLNIQPEPLIEYYKKIQSEGGLDTGVKSTQSRKRRKRPIDPRIVMPVLMTAFLAVLILGSWKLWQYVSKNYMGKDLELKIEHTINIDNSNISGTPINEDPSTLSLPVIAENYTFPPVKDTPENNSDIGDGLPSEGSSLVENSTLAEGSNQAEGSIPSEEALQVDEIVSVVEDSVPGVEDSVPGVEDSVPGVEDSTSDVDDSSISVAGPLNEGITRVRRSEESGVLVADVASEANSEVIIDNRLILEFSGNSWISIKDANNKIISTGLKRAGKKLKLEGKRPYKVFLGDATVVKVSINGKLFEHSSYINEKNIARFHVK